MRRKQNAEEKGIEKKERLKRKWKKRKKRKKKRIKWQKRRKESKESTLVNFDESTHPKKTNTIFVN